MSPKCENVKELYFPEEDRVCGLSIVTTSQQENRLNLTEEFSDDEEELFHSSDEVNKSPQYQGKRLNSLRKLNLHCTVTNNIY